MRAVVYRTTGPARDVLQVAEMPDPLPQPGEVRVRVAYSGVNPSDVKARADVAGVGMAHEFVVPHQDGSGVIDRVGEGVDPARIGDRVWIFHAQLGRQMGSAAEYVCLPAWQAMALPAATPLEIGAAVGLPLMTAWSAVHLYENLNGKTVLIAGGAGNVGLYAIQLAKLAGARVISTVSGANTGKADAAREAGADLVLDYRDEALLVDEVKRFTAQRGVDVVIEVNASHNASLYPSLLAHGGRVIVYGSQQADIALSYRGMMRVMGTVSFFLIYMLPPDTLARVAAAVTGLLEQGRLRHQQLLPFAPEQAFLAHEHAEAGHAGKALIAFGIDVPGLRPIKNA
jgi:NADPH2:quinone reductase